MISNKIVELSDITTQEKPFPHFYSSFGLNEVNQTKIYDWLHSTIFWELSKTHFYEQFEFNLLTVPIPEEIKFLIQDQTKESIVNKFKLYFDVDKLDLVSVVAHKLIDGQKIGIHNDFINGEETHRLVLHFNPKWREENGGFLMLFNSSDSQDVASVFNPVSNFAFAFEISHSSHHAVSKIYNFTRYTIVYTFKKA